MNKSILIFFSLFLSITSCYSQEKVETLDTTTYFFIRHTEKDLSDPNNRNPNLTEEGKSRAQNWANMLADIKVDMVFSTDYIRTKQTADPIAKSKNLEIIIYNPRHLNDPEFKQKTKGKTSVIVGHSNTTPAFVNTILGQEKYSSLSEKDYGKVFIVTVTGENISDIVLNYN
ncbi:histidine phosphatase family protein [Aquimarina sp. MMG016]|uniref:SixA phosphatase family protein n=1 Tax=Aquimarina sp. MMG016 TaxID=2822690 RepID=UPI001B3A2360|nr:histidine phosphatase family protein [Aquimarina sp. MMG016]MBQ4821145.1 histidine phosphatase family protein [Aquimarina sp. MMG016]